LYYFFFTQCELVNWRLELASGLTFWYQPASSGGYVVVGAPLGTTFAAVPPGAVPICLGETTYYYLNGAYYVQRRTTFQGCRLLLVLWCRLFLPVQCQRLLTGRFILNIRVFATNLWSPMVSQTIWQ